MKFIWMWFRILSAYALAAYGILLVITANPPGTPVDVWSITLTLAIFGVLAAIVYPKGTDR